MVVTSPLIRLVPKKRKPLITLKPSDIPIVGKILSPKATPFLAGAATFGAGAPALTAAKVFFGTALGVGILQKSPKARSLVVQKVKDPTKIGRGVGGLIEDPGKLLPKEKSIVEKVKDVGKEAGLIGAGAALAVGGAKLIPKIKEKITGKPSAKVVTQSTPLLPVQAPQIQQPVGAVEKPSVVEKPVAKEPPGAPSIKNVFKPSIDISFRSTRKFINQQVDVR